MRIELEDILLIEFQEVYYEVLPLLSECPIVHIIFIMEPNRSSKPLSEAFFQKLQRIVELASDTDCLIWNSQGNGVIITDQQTLEHILASRFQIHLRTFRKMLMLYDFKRTHLNSGEDYSHYCITNKTLQVPPEESPETKLRIKQREEISIEQKLRKQQAITHKLGQLTKNIREGFTKSESLSTTLKQRCKANDRIIDSIMFKLMTNSAEEDKQQLVAQIRNMKELLKKNQQDIRSSLALLQKNFKEEEQLCQLFKEDKHQEQQPKSQSLHYLTEPEIKHQNSE